MSRSDQDEKNRIPGIMIAAVGSGSGKTLITCALLHILKQNNINPASFKCGPDYIDPMFHKKMLGVPSRNLDVFLSGRDGIMQVLRKGMRDSDLAVIEGVMGFFDGISASSSEGSSCDIARITGIPVILVVNCRGMSRSIIPIIKGFAGYDGGCSIKGVILNNISDTLFDKIREDVIRETGLPVIAHLPHMEDAVFRSRHLGLLMPDEITDMHERTVRAAEQLDKRLDIKKLLLLCTGDASVMPPENITPDAIMPGDIASGFTDARQKSEAGDDVYAGRIQRSVAVMEKDERGGMTPGYAGAYVAKIAMKKKSKPLVALGPMYKGAAVLAKLLPRRLSNWIVGLMYAK